MTQTITYSSPSPDVWSVALANVRREGLTLTERAEQLQVGSGSFTIDDDAGTAGHSSDGVVGLKNLKVEQDACSVARLFTGYVGERGYGRGSAVMSTAAIGRGIDVSVVDLNAKAGFLRITGTDGKRSAETVSVRLAWLLASDYVDSLFAASSYNDASSVTMDATDYRGQTPGDVIADCALAAKGFNAFIFYDPVAAADVLWFANSNTSTSYSSTIKVSNVAADVDSTATFAPAEDWKLVRRPDRVVAGVYLPYAKGATYQTRTATADTYAWRDGVAPNATVKTKAAAAAIAKQFLWENHTEEDRLTVRLRMRAAYVNLVRQGQRMQVKLSNIPDYASYTWFRVLSRTVTQPLKTDNDYDVELELSPQEAAAPTCDYPLTAAGTYYPLGLRGYFPSPGVNASDGVVFYLRPGLTYPTFPDEGFIGDWRFPTYGAGGVGTTDKAHACFSNELRFVVVGNGTMVIHTAAGAAPITFDASLERQTIAGDYDESTYAVTSLGSQLAGTNVTVVITGADPPVCISVVTLTNWTDVGCTSVDMGWTSMVWTPA